MAELENLTIQISAEASAADDALDNLVSKLNTLSNSLGKLNGPGLKNFSDAMQTFTSAMQGIKDVNASQFTKVAKGIQKFESIDSGKIASVSDAMKPLAQSINTLNGLTFDGANINSFVNSLAKLSQTNAGNLNSVDFASIGNSIKKMTDALSGASDVSRNTISITNAVAKLGATGGVIGQVTSELPALGTALRTFIATMSNAGTVSGETITFTAAIGQLASAGARTATTAANLSTLATELKNFFTVMSSAPTVSNNIVQMTQALANLASQGSKVGSASKSIVSGFDSFSVGAKKASKSATSLAAAFGKFYATWWLVIRLFRKIGEAIDISSDLTEVQNVVDVTFGQYKSKMEDFAGTVSMTEFGISELTAKTIGSRYQAMANAIGLTNDEAANANTFLSSMTDGYIEAGGGVADMSVNLTKLAADMASLYNVEADEVAESLQSVYTGTTQPLRQYGLDLTQATLQEWALKNGLDADISSMTQAEKVLLRYQYVLANTTDAQGDFARTADTWANRVKVLGQQFLALARIVGEVFINALKPALRALNSFMDSVINIARTIADALGAIFGWTIDTSSYSALSEEAYDTADGLSDAADSAKKLNKQQQGFDELNVITTSDSGSEADGNGLGSISASETGLEETESLLDHYKSSIESLGELGEYIGQKLTNSMNNIDWDSIYDKARNFGTGLADFLNGLISPELFYEVGKTIANSLNTAIYTTLTFAKDFDWENFGDSIAEGINGLFETFDFGGLADTIDTWVQGAYTTIKSALEELDWSTIWSGVVDFISHIDIETVEIIVGVFALKWGAGALAKVGSSAASAIAKSIAKKLSVALPSLSSIATGFSDVVAAIAPFASIIAGVSLVVVGLVAAVASFVSMWNEGFSLAKEAVMLLNIALVAIGAVILGVSAPVAAAVAAIVAVVATAVILIKDNWESISGFFIGLWDGIKTTASDLWDAVTGFFSGAWDTIKGVWEAVSGWFSDNVIEPVVGFFQGLWMRVKQIFEGLWIIIQAVWVIVSTWFSENVIEPVVGLFQILKEKVTTVFTTLWNAVKAVFEPVLTWFKNKIITPVTNAFKTATEKISVFFTSLWSGIKKGVVGAMNGVIGGIESAINTIVGGINSIISGFNKIVSWAAKVAEVNWGGVDLVPKVTLTKISGYEVGGFPDKASLFWAGENGATELLGTVGGKTAVAGGEEITGIADAVYSTGQTEASLLQTAISLLDIIAAKEFGISKGDLYKSVRQSDKEYARRTGASGFVF